MLWETWIKLRITISESDLMCLDIRHIIGVTKATRMAAIGDRRQGYKCIIKP